MTTKRYIMCYFTLNHNDSLILDMFYIKLSWNFVFLKNIESVISWYYMPQFFEAVKEFYNLRFLSTTTFSDTKVPLPQHI